MKQKWPMENLREKVSELNSDLQKVGYISLLERDWEFER